MEAILPAPPAHAAASPVRLTVVFAVLFIAYQLPEGLGIHVLHSVPVLYALMLAFVPIAWLAGRALGFRGLDAWYIRRSPRWALLLAACFALAVAAKAAALGAGAELGAYALGPAGQAAGSALLVSALWMAFETFVPSVAEDIVTRGFLMRAMPALSRRWVFVVASAVLYVLNHIYRLANGPAEWLVLLCFGLAYGAALFYSRSLWPAIGLHWGWNFAGKFSDQLVSVDVVAPALHAMMSSAAHLVMLGIVVAIGRKRIRRERTGLARPA
jgi:membrane protease YdiL (CAAX protease family)